VSVYPFIEAEKAERQGNVHKACQLLEVSRAAYYEWSRHTPSRRQLSDSELGDKIVRAYERSRRTYGAPRIAKALRRDGVCVAKRRVARIMSERGLVGRCRRRWRRTTVADPVAEAADLVRRAFGPDVIELDRIYVGDITYISDVGGLGVPGERDRPGQPACRRLADRRPHGGLPRLRCP